MVPVTTISTARTTGRSRYFPELPAWCRNTKTDANLNMELPVAKANAHSTAVRATTASVHFSGYRPGQLHPFGFDVMASDAAGNLIHGPATMPSEMAVEMALYVLTAAAGLEGLTDEQREKLRSIAAMEPIFGYYRAQPVPPPRKAAAG